MFHEGDPADSFHLITRGRFAARLRTRLGDTALLSILGTGEAFGELALVGEPHPRSTTVTALEAGETRAVYGRDFARLRREHAGIDGVLVALLAEQVRRLSTARRRGLLRRRRGARAPAAASTSPRRTVAKTRQRP